MTTSRINRLCHPYQTLIRILFVTIAVMAIPQMTGAASHQPHSIWIEAEDTTSLQHGHARKYGPSSVESQVMSAGAALIPHSAETPKMKATWTLEVPSVGTWNLWVRKFWRHGPFKWRLGGVPWRTCARDVALHDDTYIRLHHGLNWVYLGPIDLAAGVQHLEVESLDNKGWMDCFLLTDGPFLPRGKLKPGEPTGAEETGWFAWEPGADPFADSPIDLRHLNEKFAGEKGYVRREGNQFVLGDGTPVRFWMTQTGSLLSMQKPMVDLHARRLAKYGVNMARLMFLDLFKTWRSGPPAAFAAKLERVHYTVAALKKQGIYTFFGHLFWDTHTFSLKDDDLPGLKKGEKATTAMFLNKPLQEKYLNFVEDLMIPKNPYTGLSLAADPAVAIIEVQNESNTLFWTLNPDNLPEHSRRLIEEAFAKYAVKKYGSAEQALATWGDKVKGDAPTQGRLGFLSAWHMTTQGRGQHAQRVTDQVLFLTEAQCQLYAHMKRRFHSLGIKKMVAGSNWKTADPSNLGPLEYYSYTATDMVCKNEYFSPKHFANKRGYAVDVDDTFVSISAMRGPEAAGVLMSAQPADWPYLIVENNWENPSKYRAEFPFFVATYGKMAGVDAWNFFAYSTQQWDTGMGVWNTNSPAVLGQYPAYALMYRRGDVLEGPPVVTEKVKRENLAAGKPIALPEIQYKDFVWQKELGGDPKVDFKSAISPRVFFTGPVRLEFTDDKPAVQSQDLAKLIDEERGVLYNTNEQLEWHYQIGNVRVNTPTSQGAAGFLKQAGMIALTDVTIESKNDYGTLVVVALDNKPLRRSGRILIQAMTHDKPYGYQTVPDTKEKGADKIVSLGGYPFLVQDIQARVTLHRRANSKVTALDARGYPTDVVVQTQAAGNDLAITLPVNTLYTIVE